MRNNSYLKVIGDKVKKARMAKKVSVRRLGEMCGTDYSNLSRFENGQVNIRLSTLKCIADKLQVDIKDLVWNKKRLQIAAFFVNFISHLNIAANVFRY